MSIRPKRNKQKQNKNSPQGKIKLVSSLAASGSQNLPQDTLSNESTEEPRGWHCPRHRMLLSDKRLSVSKGKRTVYSSLCIRSEWEPFREDMGLKSWGWEHCVDVEHNFRIKGHSGPDLAVQDWVPFLPQALRLWCWCMFIPTEPPKLSWFHDNNEFF